MSNFHISELILQSELHSFFVCVCVLFFLQCALLAADMSGINDLYFHKQTCSVLSAVKHKEGWCLLFIQFIAEPQHRSVMNVHFAAKWGVSQAISEMQIWERSGLFIVKGSFSTEAVLFKCLQGVFGHRMFWHVSVENHWNSVYLSIHLFFSA